MFHRRTKYILFLQHLFNTYLSGATLVFSFDTFVLTFLFQFHAACSRYEMQKNRREL